MIFRHVRGIDVVTKILLESSFDYFVCLSILIISLDNHDYIDVVFRVSIFSN